MLSSSNFKITHSFSIVNIAITTLKFVNKGESKDITEWSP